MEWEFVQIDLFLANVGGLLVLLACWASVGTLSIRAFDRVNCIDYCQYPVALVLKGLCWQRHFVRICGCWACVLGMRSRAVATLIVSGACVVMTIEATVSIWKRLSKDGSVLGLTFQQFFTWGFTDMGAGFLALAM
jgi:hypothetical protein